MLRHIKCRTGKETRLYQSIHFFFFQAEDGIRDYKVTGVQTCALPISICSAVASPGPTTATYRAIGSADDEVDQLVGHDDHLRDLVPVQVRLNAAGVQDRKSVV